MYTREDKRMHCTDVASMIPVILTKPGTYSLDGVARSNLEELSLVRIHPLPSLSSSLHSKSLIKKALRETKLSVEGAHE